MNSMLVGLQCRLTLRTGGFTSHVGLMPHDAVNGGFREAAQGGSSCLSDNSAGAQYRYYVPIRERSYAEHHDKQTEARDEMSVYVSGQFSDSHRLELTKSDPQYGNSQNRSLLRSDSLRPSPTDYVNQRKQAA